MFARAEIKTKNNSYDFQYIKNDESTSAIILNDWNEFSPHIFSNTKERKTVIQAGGNCGMYALFYSETFDNVFTFEPDPKNFYCLSENCKNNKIVKFNTAIGDQNQFCNMNVVNQQNLGMNKIVKGDGYKVFCLTIDSLDIPDVSLIHLDIEGYEYEALVGAEKTILKYKPTLVLEISRKKDKIYQLLNKLSYKEQNAFGGNSSNFIFTAE